MWKTFSITLLLKHLLKILCVDSEKNFHSHYEDEKLSLNKQSTVANLLTTTCYLLSVSFAK